MEDNDNTQSTPTENAKLTEMDISGLRTSIRLRRYYDGFMMMRVIGTRQAIAYCNMTTTAC